MTYTLYIHSIDIQYAYPVKVFRWRHLLKIDATSFFDRFVLQSTCKPFLMYISNRIEVISLSVFDCLVKVQILFEGPVLARWEVVELRPHLFKKRQFGLCFVSWSYWPKNQKFLFLFLQNFCLGCSNRARLNRGFMLPSSRDCFCPSTLIWRLQ